MKKFMTFAAMFAAVAMSFSACTKDNGDDNGKTPETEVCPDCGEALEDCTCEEEFVSAITVDGKFDDWAAITPLTATCDPDAKYTALETLKVYTDEMYTFTSSSQRTRSLTLSGYHSTFTSTRTTTLRDVVTTSGSVRVVRTGSLRVQ